MTLSVAADEADAAMGALLTAGERRRAPCAPPAFSICDSEFMRARICVNVPSIPVTSISRCPEPRAMRRRRDADCARRLGSSLTLP